ncbi:hypothetical protein [Streptomyces sp. NPDC057336]|uniref:hypothetical protein n=1 Tax=Streptomyces sp. NPDC057336 TaxID=3346102 RepID=UPI003641C62B
MLGPCSADLGSGVVTLDDLWGGEASRVRERLGAAPTWRERLELVDALLVRRCRTRPPADPEVAWAWQRIVAGGGLVRVEHLAAELGWSRKRLWSRFRSGIGVPPERAARLVRFDRAVRRLVGGATPATAVGEPFLAVDDRAWPV